jgi:hypothetical protein
VQTPRPERGKPERGNKNLDWNRQVRPLSDWSLCSQTWDEEEGEKNDGMKAPTVHLGGGWRVHRPHPSPGVSFPCDIAGVPAWQIVKPHRLWPGRTCELWTSSSLAVGGAGRLARRVCHGTPQTIAHAGCRIRSPGLVVGPWGPTALGAAFPFLLQAARQATAPEKQKSVLALSSLAPW